MWPTPETSCATSQPTSQTTAASPSRPSELMHQTQKRSQEKNFFFFSNTNCTEKTVGFSGIRTQIVGIKGEHADHLTTTTTRREEIYLKILFHPSVRPRRLLMRPFDFPMPMASHSE